MNGMDYDVKECWGCLMISEGQARGRTVQDSQMRVNKRFDYLTKHNEKPGRTHSTSGIDHPAS